ncbi:lipoprotein nlpC [Klebsiella pneumoniae]|nr:lipoprotein nlpC [Klebsiella pneumoniae]
MRFWFMLAAALILAGCSSHRAPPPNPRLADSITVVANLNEQLRSWRGAPYRYGGMTPRGVDCSGFVVRTFRDKFALQLPRETASRRKSAPASISAICCPAIWCSSKPAQGRAACTLASTIPTTSLFTPPPARASPVPRWITSTGTKSSGRRGESDVIQKQEGSERFPFLCR